MFQSMTAAPQLRPMLNIGCLFDIPTGRYHTGARGESILNGGYSPLVGVAGRGNTFKSTLLHFQILCAMARYKCAHANFHDTELSMTRERLIQLGGAIRGFDADIFESGRATLTDSTTYSGNAWFEVLKNLLNEKRKAGDKSRLTTPFVDKQGKVISSWIPSLIELDSFSQFDTDSVTKIQDANSIGDSGMNIEALRSAHAKNQLLMQLPALCAGSGAYMGLSAHVGDDLQLDPYAPPQKKLMFLKNKVKFKNVPEKFTFLTFNCWFCAGAAVLANQTTKAPEYPRGTDDDMKGDTDLIIVTVQNLRGKSGPTGLPTDIIVSQAEGVQVGLTEFHYIKSTGRFGLGGNDRNYFVELCPDISLSRTTVRAKISENLRLQRALEICSEMCQMQQLWHHMEERYFCTPAQLYADLKTKGYDWDVLLDTRGFWTFEEDKHPQKFLSTMDLLKMRLDEYKPYWM